MDREWDFDEAIKSGYWYEPEFFAEALEKIINPPHRFIKHYMACCHYSKDAAPGWYNTALTYARSNISLVFPGVRSAL